MTVFFFPMDDRVLTTFSEEKLQRMVDICGGCKAQLDWPNDGSRSAGEGLCILQSFLFTTQEH